MKDLFWFARSGHSRSWLNQRPVVAKTRVCGPDGKRRLRGVAAQILAVLLALSAGAETVSVPIKTLTQRYITVVQPEGRQAVVYQRTNDNWRIWFVKGRPMPGGEVWRVDVTNAAVKAVRVNFQ